MNENYDRIDRHKSPIFIKAGLIEASHHQNEWFLGERAKHRVDPAASNVDWTVYHAKAFSNRFEQNKQYIIPYVDKHRDEFKVVDGKLVFTDEQFNHLMSKDLAERVNGEKTSQLLAA